MKACPFCGEDPCICISETEEKFLDDLLIDEEDDDPKVSEKPSYGDFLG